MRALILVGGFGTRLRPLTFETPKPLVPFCNKPMVLHQIEALARAGVTNVVLAVNYQPETMSAALDDFAARLGITITISIEETPLGTAGPLALAREHLENPEGIFLVLNADVSCSFPFEDLIAFHKAHGKEGTIMVTRVEDPSKYGVVVTAEDGMIEQFVEKPSTFVSDRINAGIYCFSTGILDRIELKPTSIERVIFPAMAADNEIYAMDLPGYWMDVGQPPDYLTGMGLFLDWLASGSGSSGTATGAELAIGTLAEEDGERIRGNVLIHPDATVDETAVLGPDVVIGPGCVVGANARLSRTSLLAGAQVGAGAKTDRAIIGWDSVVGRWARVDGVTVLGADVVLAEGIYVNGCYVCPHKKIKADEPEPRNIL